MPDTALYEEAVCRDRLIEPDLRINTISCVCHLRDMAPTEWPDQDREKYHQIELKLCWGANTNWSAVDDKRPWIKIS
jgi:hypothetical protein